MTESVWIFDVDGCLVDSLTGTSLRPGTVRLLTHLRESGATVLVWSAGGAPYARQRVEQHGIAELFDGFHGKDTRDESGSYRVHHLAGVGAQMVFVDDRPEDLPTGTPAIVVVPVAPYLADNPHDRAFHRLAQTAGLTAFEP